MDYVRLGASGMKVSRICLGCMSFGVPERGGHPWSLNEELSRPLIRKALEAGINFFDTANVYSDGTSEEITGKALKDFTRRTDVVLATKVHGPMGTGPNDRGLSRKAILQEMDASLKRLGTDYVDLYQIHRLDRETPMEEILEALHDVVKAGKARYVGASSMHAWQFAKMLGISERRGWARFVSMQDHYNLMYREEEREMAGLCVEEGVGMIPWSPLARGLLARPLDASSTHRSEGDHFTKRLYAATVESDRKVLGAVEALSKKRGLPMAQIALAWLLGKPGVCAPIIGATPAGHIEDAVAALSVKLAPEEVHSLEEPYVPHAISGFE